MSLYAYKGNVIINNIILKFANIAIFDEKHSQSCMILHPFNLFNILCWFRSVFQVLTH